MDQMVVPAVGLPDASVQVKAAPPQSCTSMPRCFLYQSRIPAGSRAWKKMPPMPVTLFIVASLNHMVVGAVAYNSVASANPYYPDVIAPSADARHEQVFAKMTLLP